ncbi:MAG: hypothetical protein IT185_11160, partial [Acidobacteria bacterium]|nr:hypothetical protein [Acidobacteriota bacterium]
MTPNTRKLVAAAGVAAASAGWLVAATPQVTFRASSDIVAVYATVRDSTGKLVRGLTKDDF